ncbi:hypothetical protein LTR56_000878 [Elasticomyces elasticus]|nr:hypothetical protein LTR56_000878 [Elasticomyces elasticus]KAK3665452.1 hypothetical protein LTR22_003682 [Elasticomyces elasticus]KAK5769285.1 hypothetical protein LTS12_000636 [Elasticomyces elasticus]
MLRDIELNAACTGISQDRERDAGHDPATTGSLGRAPAISPMLPPPTPGRTTNANQIGTTPSRLAISASNRSGGVPLRTTPNSSNRRRRDPEPDTPRTRRRTATGPRRLEFEQDAVQAKEMAERMRRNNPNRPRREANTGESADPDAVGSVRRDINTFTGRADRARARM